MRNAHAIERNEDAIERNAHAIECNEDAIVRNGYAIELNAHAMQSNAHAMQRNGNDDGFYLSESMCGMIELRTVEIVSDGSVMRL